MKRKYRKWKLEIDNLISMVDEGLTTDKIAEEYGVEREYIVKIMNTHGISINRLRYARKQVQQRS